MKESVQLEVIKKSLIKIELSLIKILLERSIKDKSRCDLHQSEEMMIFKKFEKDLNIKLGFLGF